jgi:dihydroxy-acid dehydratase
VALEWTETNGGQGCDKTTPAQLMGGISANKPIVHLVTGPMMPGSHRGARIGACTDCRNNWAKFRAGAIDVEDISAVNDELAPTVSRTFGLDRVVGWLTQFRLAHAA